MVQRRKAIAIIDDDDNFTSMGGRGVSPWPTSETPDLFQDSIPLLRIPTTEAAPVAKEHNSRRSSVPLPIPKATSGKRLSIRRRAMPLDYEPDMSMELDSTTARRLMDMADGHGATFPPRRTSAPQATPRSQPPSIESRVRLKQSLMSVTNRLKQNLMVGSEYVPLKQSPRLLVPIDSSASPSPRTLSPRPLFQRTLSPRPLSPKLRTEPVCDQLLSSTCCLPPIQLCAAAAV